MERKILKNKAKCNHCGDVLESKHVHDFVKCSCGRIFIDGGKEYLRFGCHHEADIQLLTEYSE
jgi:tRNA(Ile2) C34 agmatinyltransferase TiaS